MGKGARSYIKATKNNAPCKLYLEDVRTWSYVIKKQTPRLPAYDEENNNMKWD